MPFPYIFPFNFDAEYFKWTLETLNIDISERPIRALNMPTDTGIEIIDIPIIPITTIDMPTPRPIQPLDLYEPEEITEVLYI